MTATRSHPAVFAGLLGSAAWGVPKLVIAAPMDEVVEAVNRSLVLQFVIGCAAGALIAGAIAFVSDRLAPAEEEQADSEPHWSESSLNLATHQAEEGEDDPTGDLGRFRTGQITIDLPVVEVAAAVRASSGPRHFAAAKTRAAAKSASHRAGRHFATSESDQLVSLLMATEPTRPNGRHFAHAVAERTARHKAQVPVAPKAVAVAEPVTEGKAAEVPEKTPLTAKERLQNLPVIEPRAARAIPAITAVDLPVISSVEPEAEPAASKKADEATLGFTGRLRLKMAERAKGVREVLAERLGEGALDGVPQITRADGTSVEVTPTWFDQTLVPAIASITGITNKLDDTAARASQETVASAAETEERPEGEDSRASYISRHVAEVNVGMFPERRSVDELEHDDAWEEALAAMGETIGQSAPVFQDVVGGPATIDDPDGLEGSTGFIPFRVPAAHPEVVDTESYIDYLLRDEMSGNTSQALRRSSRSYLRVIEGGTNPMRIRRLANETGAHRLGRHFSQPRYAQEA